MIALKINDSDIQTRLHTIASLDEITWDLRLNTPKSSASISNINRLKPIHNQIVSSNIIYTPKLGRGATKKRDTTSNIVVVSPSVCYTYNQPRAEALSWRLIDPN